MNKFVKYMAVSVLLMSAATVATSCGDDKDEPTPPRPASTFRSAKILWYDLYAGNILKVADIYGTYVNDTGQTITVQLSDKATAYEPLTGPSVEMRYLEGMRNTERVPVSYVMTIHARMKSGIHVPSAIAPDKDIKMQRAYNGVAKIVLADGTKFDKVPATRSITTTVISPDEVEAYLAEKLDGTTVTVELDENYNLTVTPTNMSIHEAQ